MMDSNRPGRRRFLHMVLHWLVGCGRVRSASGQTPVAEAHPKNIKGTDRLWRPLRFVTRYASHGGRTRLSLWATFHV